MLGWIVAYILVNVMLYWRFGKNFDTLYKTSEYGAIAWFFLIPFWPLLVVIAWVLAVPALFGIAIATLADQWNNYSEKGGQNV